MDAAKALAANIFLNRKLVGAFVLLIVLFTLTLDVAGLVFPCPYCRTQRFALGVLAIILLTPGWSHFFARFIALLIGSYGLIVGVMQNFNHVKKINKGEFDWSAMWIGHPWLLSGLAVIALSWMFCLIFDLPNMRSARPAIEPMA